MNTPTAWQLGCFYDLKQIYALMAMLFFAVLYCTRTIRPTKVMPTISVTAPRMLCNQVCGCACVLAFDGGM